MAHFGTLLKERRERMGLSRRAMSERTGIPVDILAYQESAAALPERRILSSFADVLGTTPDELALASGVIPRWIHERMTSESGEFLRILDDAGMTEHPDSESVGDRSPSALVPAYRTCMGALYNVDCVTHLRTLEADSVDVVFADPPFNLGKDYGTGINDNIADSSYLDWSMRWLGEAIRILKPGGALFLYNLPKWNLPLGAWLSNYLEFRHWIAVDIKFSLPVPGRLYPSHYSLLYFVKGAAPVRFSPPRVPIETCRHCGGEIKDYGGYKAKMNPRGVNISDVWTDISPVRHSRYKRRKANELPLKMMDRILDISSREGDLIVDPFGGSGTTYVVAELKGRRWLGTEIGDCAPIIDRFSRLDEERKYLEEIRKKVNILFTKESLLLRQKNRHATSMYRLEGNVEEIGGLFKGAIVREP